jgi:hypothetical protein
MAACVLLSVEAVSCSAPAPGAAPAGGSRQTPVTGPPPSPTTVGPGVYMSNGPGQDTAVPTTSIPAGCSAGTVAITHLPAQTSPSTVCIKAGARIRLTLPGQGLDGWYPLQVTPGGAATVAYLKAPTDTLAAIVTPTGTTPFCMSAFTRSLASQAVYGWRLCVRVRR